MEKGRFMERRKASSKNKKTAQDWKKKSRREKAA
jgi:hypothetical protein